MGKVTKEDESTVYIIPIGLDTPEGVLVGNIDSLNMENGMVPVLNSAVKYFYEKGEFVANNNDWMDEYDKSNIVLQDQFTSNEDGEIPLPSSTEIIGDVEDFLKESRDETP